MLNAFNQHYHSIMQFKLRSLMRTSRLGQSPTDRGLSRIANVHDMREIARRKLPRGVFDYIDGGAEDEVTMGRNEQDYRAL